MSTRCRTLSFALLGLSGMALVGCYDAHELSVRGVPGAADAGVTSDARVPVTTDAALRTDVAALPNACALPSETLAVPAGGCTAHTFTDTAGNACDRDGDPARRVVRLVRPTSGSEWYFLIRSRDPAATRIAMGRLDPQACTCRFHASASGGDLTLHGIGGDLGTRDDEVDLVLDGDGGPMWLRVCDGPPR